MRIIKIIFILILCLLIVEIAAAQSGSLKLLAVQELNGSYKGSMADLHLEIKEGTGRIFLETYPQTFDPTNVCGWRYPDSTELKASIFLALAHGAKGIHIWKFATNLTKLFVKFVDLIPASKFYVTLTGS